MSTPMTAANINIINELKKFTCEVATQNSLKEQYCYSKTSFTRNRVLTLQYISILIISALKRSLSIELQDFFGQISTDKQCSKQAFCEQRVKLKPSFFQDMNQVLVSNFYHYYGEQAKRWKDMILCAVDGSSVPLPATEELRQIYGGSSNQYGEQGNVIARICVLYDVLNEIVIKNFLHPYFVSEEKVLPQCLSGIDLEDKLLLFDRGYPSYWLMYLLMQKQAKFVMRTPSNASNLVKQFCASPQSDVTVEWLPSVSSLKTLTEMGFDLTKQTPIKIRLVKVVLQTGETEILLTNLYDESVYTQKDLKEVYHLRWDIETYYGYVKNELQLGQFSGIRRICVEQDFAANTLLFNLQGLIEKQTEPYVKAVSRKRKYRYKVNKNISWASLKVRIVHLFLYHDSRSILMELEKLFGNYLEPVRPHRKYPRKKKRNPNVKYYTLTNYKRAI